MSTKTPASWERNLRLGFLSRLRSTLLESASVVEFLFEITLEKWDLYFFKTGFWRIRF